MGAKSEFYKMICEYARMGKGVILISSELPEIIGLSDRIIVMREGRVTGEVSRKDAHGGTHFAVRHAGRGLSDG